MKNAAAWSPVCKALSAALAVCAALAIGAQALTWPRAAAASIPQAPNAALPAAKVVARNRCAGCGIVRSIRRIEAERDEPASYEFVVRLRDGTLRTSSEPSASKWRVGDRVTLVGGIASTDQ